MANISYNSLQVSLAQRVSHGLSYTFNYTWSRNIGDDGTYRSGFDLPSGSVSGTSQAFHQNRIDRGLTTTDLTHNISAYAVWQIPGAGGNRFMRGLTNGFQLSTIYQFTSGTPFVPTYAGCTAPNGGTCTLDKNPNYTGNGYLAKGYRSFKTQYIDPNAFAAPSTYSTTLSTNYNKIGNLPRTAPYGIRNPYFWKDDVSLRRSFNLGTDRLKFIAEVDCLNVANHATLSNPATAWGRARHLRRNRLRRHHRSPGQPPRLPCSPATSTSNP